MAEKKNREIAATIKDFLLRRHIKVDRIILFGSRARGFPSGDSDFDIAIVSEFFEGKSIFQKAKILRGLGWLLVEKFMLPFDIISVSKKEWEEGFSPLVGFIRQGRTILR